MNSDEDADSLDGQGRVESSIVFDDPVPSDPVDDDHDEDVKQHRSTSHQRHRGNLSSSSSSRTRPVVKLVVTSVSHSYSEPWRRRTQRESGGTGFLIRWLEQPEIPDGEKDNSDTTRKPSVRIVTNAHVVRNASSVRARASFGPHVVNCTVEWLSLPLDLALVKITEGDWDDFCNGWMFSSGDYDHGVDKIWEKREKDVLPSPTESKILQKAKLECLTLSTILPKLDENVTCVGFPIGGKQISVTRGVISRIDVDSQDVLRIQIDAAINPGNSGGPVFDELGQVVGISTSVIRKFSNIGYIIPGKVVALFLQMCADGMEASIEDRFCGLGSLVVKMNDTNCVNGRPSTKKEAYVQEPKHVPGIANLSILGAQNLESKALRRSLGLEEMNLSGGVRIVGTRNVVSGTNKTDRLVTSEIDDTESVVPNEEVVDDRLQCNDVLLAINNIPIGYDGTVQLSSTRPDERINFRSLVTCQRVGTDMTLDILREKQRRELKVTLNASRFLVAQYDDFDACPLYAVCGGCVFAPLTFPLMTEKKNDKAVPFSRYFRQRRLGHEQIIVLSKVLNDEVNVGYHGWTNMILKSVNGFKPSNIQDLVDVIIKKVQDDTLEFHFENSEEEQADWVICLNMQEVLQSEQRILHRHMIASWCSMDALSCDLRNYVKIAESSVIEKSTCWNTMGGLKNVLGIKNGNDGIP